MLRMPSHTILWVRKRDLVFADPLPLRFEVEERRRIGNSGVVLIRRQSTLGKNLTHLDARLGIEVADEQDARAVCSRLCIQLLGRQGKLILPAAMVSHQRNNLEAGVQRTL